MSNHSNAICWKKETNARRSRTHSREKTKTPNKEGGKKNKNSVKLVVLSSSAEDYDESGGEEGSNVDPEPQSKIQVC